MQLNRRSPAYYLNEERFATVDVPASADPKAAPQWQTVDKTARFEWHDHRIHWMGKGLPPAVNDKNKRTKIFDWRVPVRVGGRPGAIAGTLTWVGEAGGGPPGNPVEQGVRTWPALQTYADGKVVRWIGAPDSDEPAPRVRVAESAVPVDTVSVRGERVPTATSAPAARAPAAPEGADADDGHRDGLTLGLAIGALAAALAALAVAFILRRPRREGDAW